MPITIISESPSPCPGIHTVLLVDDDSSDATVELARDIGLTTFTHNVNFGYGRNQVCWRV